MRFISITSLLLLLTSYTQAQQLMQQVIGSTGSSASAGGYNLAYTVGEIAVSTAISPNLILTQGFHQPHEQLVNINTPNGHTVLIRLFPNPTDGMVSLTLSGGSVSDKEHFSFAIFDILGRKLLVSTLAEFGDNLAAEIDFRPFTAGLYYVQVLDASENAISVTAISYVK